MKAACSSEMSRGRLKAKGSKAACVVGGQCMVHSSSRKHLTAQQHCTSAGGSCHMLSH
jgi:hypothetical protein